MAAHEIDVFSLTDITEVQQAYAQIHLHEQKLNNELDAILENQPRLDAKMNSLQNVIPNLQLVMRDAQHLHSMISNTSDLAEKVSSKVRLLDQVKNRVQETIKRVDDILDLKACVDGVQTALNTENYEQAAAHIHKYLNLDEDKLKEITRDSQEGSDLAGSFALLHEAEVKLKSIVCDKFEAAISNGDRNSVERFFKIFPLLGQHQLGLEKYAEYLCSQIAAHCQRNLDNAVAIKESERQANVVFANTLTLLFEKIARMVEEHQPSVETYYGPGKMFILLQAMQVECDKQASQVVDQFVIKRQFKEKFKSVQNSQTFKGSSANMERYDPRELDVVLREVVVMNARAEMYLKFIEKRIKDDIENIPEEEKTEEIMVIQEKVISNCELSKKMQELIGNYIYMEEYFMRETVMKAVKMDASEGGDDEAVTSSMVDDVFFIVQKAVRRALSSSSVDGTCAMLNHACALLSSDYRDVLTSRLKAGFPSGSLDFSGMLQGKIQVGYSSTAENTAARKAFLVTLNNLEVSSDNIMKLKKDLEVECERILAFTEPSKLKLESCLADLMNTSNIFKGLLQEGIYQLCSTAVIPRLKPLIDGFNSTSHNISEEEFSFYEVNDPFVQSFITSLDSMLTSFKGPLTTANYDSLVSMAATEITNQLETSVMKASFNRLGGLQFDKELRSLVGYLTAVTQWTIRDKFARLTQIATILNLEKVGEIMDYWGPNSGPMTWRLTPTEVRQVLSLRVDFRSEDINRLKL
ncbi:conserved oligomeric Golgi complex subunit 4-like [Acropora millepora]|uniref:conserved oligomeric Golgi complex subunit 4-like n=1 Tax=Acropora millepora TaxID=45264 RepID=UPI001CF1C1E7|nr:conserved oligomeric Golgi complex subunit 4-like [Acropora millepora]